MRSTLLVLADGALGERLRAAGYHVVSLDGTGDLAALLRGLAVDALVVRGGTALVGRAVALAGATPCIAVGWDDAAALELVAATLAARAPSGAPN
jgi:hypothetical protein